MRPVSAGALCCFFFNDTATTEIYTLSLHDALPIWRGTPILTDSCCTSCQASAGFLRSEEHTSELQSRLHLVCRLLLEKKKNTSAGTARARRTHSLQPPAVTSARVRARCTGRLSCRLWRLRVFLLFVFFFFYNTAPPPTLPPPPPPPSPDA